MKIISIFVTRLKVMKRFIFISLFSFLFSSAYHAQERPTAENREVRKSMQDAKQDMREARRTAREAKQDAKEARRDAKEVRRESKEARREAREGRGR